VAELIAAAGELGPWFLALLLVGLFLVYAAEKIGGKDGPISRVLAWFSNRELNALRRQGELEAERQRIAALTESRAVQRFRRRLADAYDEIEELEGTVEWLLQDRNDQRRRDRARGHFDRALVDWFQQVIRTVAEAAPGTLIPDPPRPPEGLAELLVIGDDLPPEVRRPRRRANVQTRREELEAEWSQEDEDAVEAEAAASAAAARRGGRRLTDRRA